MIWNSTRPRTKAPQFRGSLAEMLSRVCGQAVTEVKASLGAEVTNRPAAHPIFLSRQGSVDRPDRQDHGLIDGPGGPHCVATLPVARGTELRALTCTVYTMLHNFCSRRPITTVALPRISCVRLPVAAMEPQISNSLLRNAVTRGVSWVAATF